MKYRVAAQLKICKLVSVEKSAIAKQKDWIIVEYQAVYTIVLIHYCSNPGSSPVSVAVQCISIRTGNLCCGTAASASGLIFSSE